MINSRLKILLVDDSSTNNLLFQNITEEAGYETFVTTNGEEALKVIPKFKPALILLDIMMPKMDGIEVLEILNNDKDLSNIPVIVLTAKNDSQTMNKCLSLGAVDFLIKPVGIDEIINKINRIFNKNKD